MKQDFFQTEDFDVIEPPVDLFDKVMGRLDQARRLKTIRRRFVLALASFLPLFWLAIPVWRSFATEINQSGLSQYLGLLAYDFQLVLANWQDFIFSLLESFPVVSTVFILAVLLGWLIALRSVVKYGKSFFNVLSTGTKII